MKTNLRILTLAAILFVGLFTASAADKPDHKVAPKGGRLLDQTEPHAELVVGMLGAVGAGEQTFDRQPLHPGGLLARGRSLQV